MGTDCHVVVVGGGPVDLDLARDRVEELESKWSRFRADSELSRVNTRPGRPVRVSAETVAVVAAALAAWHTTNGRFDPTVLDALEAAGYDRSFADGLDRPDGPGVPRPVPGCADIELDAIVGALTVPSGIRLDLGAIAKGFAADLVAAELIARSAAGALVNIGGDLRAIGTGPTGDGWTVAIDHVPGAAVVVSNGGLATSSTTRRRWRRGGSDQHHVIDPATGRPAVIGERTATVFAPTAARAEVLATAALLAGPGAVELLSAHGASGIVVGPGGAVSTTADLRTVAA